MACLSARTARIGLTCGPAPRALNLPVVAIKPARTAEYHAVRPGRRQLIGHNWLSKGANCPLSARASSCKSTHTSAMASLGPIKALKEEAKAGLTLTSGRIGLKRFYWE